MIYTIDDPRFIKLVTEGRPIEELERILNPGNSSNAGFLGREERLLELIYDDWKIVESYGTTHQDIAVALSNAINGTHELNPDYQLEMVFQTMGHQECPWGCVGEMGTGIGYICRKDVSQEKVLDYIMDGTLRGNSLVSIPGLAIITELHPHLIGAHYFFEGRRTPYRSDSKVLINGLNLVK